MPECSRSTARYCSGACRTAAWRARRTTPANGAEAAHGPASRHRNVTRERKPTAYVVIDAPRVHARVEAKGRAAALRQLGGLEEGQLLVPERSLNP